MSVKIQRVGDAWHISCSTCAGDSILGLPVPLRPWLATSLNAHNQAIWWANWHAAEHQRTRCEPCGRDRKIPSVQIANPNEVRIGNRRFKRHHHEWQESK